MGLGIWTKVVGEGRRCQPFGGAVREHPSHFEIFVSVIWDVDTIERKVVV